MLRILTLLLAAALSADATPTSSASFIFTRTSIESSIKCRTHVTRTTAAPTPLPTNSFTKTSTREETTTITASNTLVVTGTATTYTPTVISYSSTTLFSSLDTQTVTTFIYDTTTVGTLITTETICANGTSPSVTSTVYTGTLVPSGGPTEIPRRFPDYVNCTTARITRLTAFPTLTAGVTTITYHPGTPASTVTAISTRTVYTFNTPPTVVDTICRSSYVATETTVTVSTSCPATATTSYAAKCSGPNLIDQVNGHGIATVSNAPGSASVLGGNGRDASSCCQLCQENIGCAAFYDLPAAGNCALYFTNATAQGEGECGPVFWYGAGIGQNNNAPTDAGQGSIVGAGCGLIEPVGDDGPEI